MRMYNVLPVWTSLMKSLTAVRAKHVYMLEMFPFAILVDVTKTIAEIHCLNIVTFMHKL